MDRMVSVDWDRNRWAKEVGVFLKKSLTPQLGELKMYTFDMTEASRLLSDGIKLGLIPECFCASVGG